MAKHIALVTGGNRGLGKQVCLNLADEGVRVLVSGRNLESCQQVADQINASGEQAEAVQLNVSDEASVKACAEALRKKGVSVDILVNNAGVMGGQGPSLEIETDEMRSVMETNFYGPLWTTLAFMPAMLERGFGRIVNVSSGYGAISSQVPGPIAYGLSKASLNALTVKFASEVPEGVDLKVNAVCPGWVRTDMGGADADRSIEEGADGISWLATVGQDAPSGTFFRDRKPIAW